MSWAEHLKDLAYDQSKRYDLVVVSDQLVGPDYELRNVSALDLIEHVIENDIPETYVYVLDHLSGQLTNLLLEEQA